MKFSYFIAKRYVFSKSTSNAINVITYISIIGIAIGAMALYIMLSGFSGLKTFSLKLISSTDPDLKITPSLGKKIYFNQDLEDILKNQDGVISFSKIVEEQAFLEFESKTQIANIKGVDSNYVHLNRIDTLVVNKTWLDETIPESAIIGNEIAYALSIGTYNFEKMINVYVPNPGKGYIRNPNKAFNFMPLISVGVFNYLQVNEQNVVYINLSSAQSLLNYTNDEISAIALKVEKNNQKKVQSELEQKMGDSYTIKNRKELNDTYHRMLNIENLMLYIIFTLILIIAFFNVIGSIIMTILNKKENLFTFHNLGATIKSIQQVFILHGIIIATIGLLSGLFLGILVVFLQKEFQFLMINPLVPYPVEFNWLNLAVVILTIFSIGFVSIFIASTRVLKILKLQK